jgi:excisionase family DNA binding protein
MELSGTEWNGKNPGMNTITLNLTLTGQITLDPQTLEQFFPALPTSAPAPTTAHPSLAKLAYSVKETAQLLGVSNKSVYRLIQRGLLKSSLALRHKRIPRTEIERFLRETTGD